MIEELEKLKESRIDFILSSCSECVSMSLGHETEGLKHHCSLQTVKEVGEWIFDTVFEHYPDSHFTKFYDPTPREYIGELAY